MKSETSYVQRQLTLSGLYIYMQISRSYIAVCLFRLVNICYCHVTILLLSFLPLLSLAIFDITLIFFCNAKGFCS